MGQAIRVVPSKRIAIGAIRRGGDSPEPVALVRSYGVHSFVQRFCTYLFRSVVSNCVGTKKALVRGEQTRALVHFNATAVSALEKNGVEGDLLFSAPCPPVDCL